MGIRLGANRYGKAENRVVRIVRDTERHEIHDLNVSTSLRGDFEAAHVDGDQSAVLPTDTQKNTAFAYAKQHGVSLDRGLRARARAAAAHGHARRDRRPRPGRGARLGPDLRRRRHLGGPRPRVRPPRAARSGPPRSTSPRDGATVASGLTDLVVLKSTGSEFRGFLKDEFTTLPEADDRVLATSLTASWRWSDTALEGGVEWNAAYGEIRSTLLELFATTYSRALQETLWAMGRAVLERQPGVAEISFVAPNKHHHLVDLSPFGIANDGEVFIAADRPYGLIEATVTRDDA